VLVGGRLWLRPSWEDAREGSVDVIVDPGRAFGTGAHPTTRLCLEYLLELEAAGDATGPLTDLGTGSGVLAVAASKLGGDPVTGYDHEAPSIEAATANAAINGVKARFERRNLRESLPTLAPTVVANMTAPVLKQVANLLVGDPGRAPRSNSEEAPASPSPVADTWILSGLLPGELDEIATLYAGFGLAERDRRTDGDWAALLLAAL
jgi:ribosomal protein L11 methyltransferase